MSPRILGRPPATQCVEACAYCPHRIMSGTIRDNILFSHQYDEIFYNLVLDGRIHYAKNYCVNYIEPAACALRPDLAILPNGDLTEVGEKGITVGGMPSPVWKPLTHLAAKR